MTIVRVCERKWLIFRHPPRVWRAFAIAHTRQLRYLRGRGYRPRRLRDSREGFTARIPEKYTRSDARDGFQQAPPSPAKLA
jgi:hypothetical protein